MTKTYQFHRKGDILTATPVEPAHEDTCGYFAGLKNGEVAVVWPCAADGTIDTTYGVDTWEFYRGSNRKYHRIYISELEVYDAPVDDGEPIDGDWRDSP